MARHTVVAVAILVVAVVTGTAIAQVPDQLVAFDVSANNNVGTTTVDGQPGLIKTSTSNGWSAFASSTTSFDVSSTNVAGVTFKPAQTTSNLMVGLTLASRALPTNYRAIQYALHVSSLSSLIVWQSGSYIGLFNRNYKAGDTLEVRINQRGFVEFVHEGNVFYTASTRAPTGAYRVDVTFNEPSATVYGIAWASKQVWCDDVTCQAKDQCNDAGTCTFGVCSDVPKENGSPCNDGNAATINDVCVDGVCQGTDPCTDVECDPIPCREPSSCVGGTCIPGALVDDNTPCDDNNDQTFGDRCLQGMCTGITTTTSTTSTTTIDLCEDVTCEQTNPCIEFVCSNGECVPGTVADDGTTCDDNNIETENDQCTDGVCSGVDKCDGVTCPPQGPCERTGECVLGVCQKRFVSEGTACDDGNPVTIDDRCYSGVCTGQDPCIGQVCTPLSQCHVAGECIDGSCTNPLKPVNTSCDDGNDKTLNDVCTAQGECRGVDPCEGVVCSPIGQCYEAGECVNGVCTTPMKPNDTECDDNNPDTDDDVCVNGVCKGIDYCEGVTCETRECFPEPECNSGECVYGDALDDGTPCDDGDEATHMDACFDAICSGVSKCLNVQCFPLSQCHEAGECSLGVCSNPTKENGSPCNDGNVATDNDQCIDGECIGTNLCDGKTCEPRNECEQVSGCFRGQCLYEVVENGKTCDDGNEMTSEDQCLGGVCTGVKPAPDACKLSVLCPRGQCPSHPPAENDIPCEDSDGDVCTEASCRFGQCVQSIAAPDEKPCDDGDIRTDFDQCIEGECKGQDLCDDVTCRDPRPCELQGVCFRGNCTFELRDEGTTCDDGLDESIGDMCSLDGFCIATVPAANECQSEVECIDGVCEDVEFADDDTPCTDMYSNNTCNTALCREGQCVQQIPVQNGIECDDGNAATDNDACMDGMCRGIDFCDNVTCPQPGICRQEGQCFRGDCTYAFAEPGTSCDDENPLTDFDSCNQLGQCVGVDLCEVNNVVCQPLSQCHVPGICANGICSESLPKQDLTPCNDGNDRTRGDVCREGVCVGVADAPSECLLPAACPNGNCPSHLPKPDGTSCTDTDDNQCTEAQCTAGFCIQSNVVPTGTPCDDGNEATDFDQCTGLTCAGIDLCDDVTCPEPGVCRQEGVCFRGNCSYAFADVGTSCNDGDPLTDDDACNSDGDCEGVDLCIENNVVCEPLSQCHAPGICANGVCGESLPLVNGTSCDDGRRRTINDTCYDGRCVGLDLCEDVICQPLSQCHEVGTCVPETGECTNPLKVSGTPCNDLNDRTSNDVCIGEVCAGVDLCLDVQCTPKDQCHEVGSCFRGVCSDPPKENGTPCDDGNPDTDDDVCMDGLCAGVDPCEGVTCTALGPCYDVGECRDGVCTNPARPQDSLCDDDDFSTYLDSCTAGLCAGRLPCTDGCVAWETKTDVVETEGYGLRRAEGLDEGWTAGAFSHDAVEMDNDWAGVRFEAAQVDKNVIVGLTTHPNSGPSFTDVDFGAFLTARGDLFIYEKGAFRANARDYEHGDEIQVRVNRDGRVEYLLRGSVVYTSKLETEYPLHVDLSMYDPDSAVVGFEWVSKQEAWCDGVSCPDQEQCKTNSVCVLGVCTDMQNLPANTTCNDGNDRTDFDVCDGQGQCSGVDLCEVNDVVCEPQSPCHFPGECFRGECGPSLPRPAGSSCNDGDERTDNDVCRDDGVCAGVDLCIVNNVTCDPPATCRAEGVCFIGQCSSDLLEEGATCDDDNERTDFDACTADGFCVGVDLCEANNVSCPPDQCRANGTCFRGDCLYDFKTNGLACDDGDSVTSLDQCTDGVCLGVDLCANVTCPEPAPCRDDGVCVAGQCIFDLLKANTSCSDGNERTTDDRCSASGQCIGVDLCVVNNVTCPAGDDCYMASECFQGECLPRVALDNGTPCTDTDGNQCTVASCMMGQCMQNVTRPDGASCDDGSDETDPDTCQAGVCVGDDLCEGIVCTPPSQCHRNVPCSKGECPSVFKDDGARCDDGNDLTINDQCVRGNCVGTSLTCVGTVTSAAMFSNGCGGTNIGQTRWLPGVGSQPCMCRSSFQGNQLYTEFDGLLDTPEKCSHMICTGGLLRFQECTFNGVVVARGSWNQNVVTVPFDFQSTICETSGTPITERPTLQQTTASTMEDSTTAATTTVMTTSSQIATTTSTATLPYGLRPGTGVNFDVDWRLDIDFFEASLVVRVGDSVTWTWSTTSPLNVISGNPTTRTPDGRFNSGSPAFSGSFTHRFTQTGRFEYYSQLQSWMVGVIEVVPSVTAESTLPADHMIDWNFEVDDATIEIAMGETVQWSWDTPEPINVVSGERGASDAGFLFESGPVTREGTYKVSFLLPGVYFYHSLGFAWMNAAIIVRDPSTTTTSTTSTTTLPPTTIYGLLEREDDRFSFLRSAVDDTGLQLLLDGTVDLTVFAPTNEVFAALPEDDRNALTSDATLLRELLTKHVVGGALTSSSIAQRSSISTLQGEQLTVEVNGNTITLDGVEVVEADYEATNGLLHVLDGILLLNRLKPTTAPPTTTSTTPALPSSTDLLDPNNHNRAISANQDGSYSFDGESALRVTSFFGVGNTFAAAVVAQQAPGTSGYLFAKSDAAGLRYYSLYSSASSSSLVFYYRTTALPGTLRAAAFPFVMSDGVTRQILVLVQGAALTLRVGSAFQQTVTLDGQVTDCSSNSPTCLLFVGQRASSSPSGGAFEFTGTIFNAALFYGAVFEHPFDLPDSATTAMPPTTTALVTETPPSSAVDLLGVTSVNAGSTTVGQAGSIRVFDGSAALLLQAHPTAITATSPQAFTFKVSFVQQAGTNGYLFCKSDAQGAMRYYCLYSSSTSSRLSFFYVIDGQRQTMNVPVVVSDGRPHTAVVTLDDRQLRIDVDGRQAGSISVSDSLEDCGAASSSCLFMLGRRASISQAQAFYLTGQMSEAMYIPGQSIPNLIVPTVLDMLDSDNNDGAVSSTGGVYTFDGDTGLAISNFDSMSSFVEVRMTARVQPDTSGYLFAKSTNDGLRFYSLYVSRATGSVILYYATGAGSNLVQRSSRFSNVGLNDGQQHDIRITITSSVAELAIDGVVVGANTVAGVVADCGTASSTCFLHVGKRMSPSSGAFFLTGEVSAATISY